MASAARMVLKPSSHSSITGRRRCSHSNVAGGWTLLRTLGAPLTVARCSSSPRRGHGGMAVGRLHAAVGRERSCHGLQERGACPRACPRGANLLWPFQLDHSWTYPRGTLEGNVDTGVLSANLRTESFGSPVRPSSR